MKGYSAQTAIETCLGEPQRPELLSGSELLSISEFLHNPKHFIADHEYHCFIDRLFNLKQSKSKGFWSYRAQKGSLWGAIAAAKRTVVIKRLLKKRFDNNKSLADILYDIKEDKALQAIKKHDPTSFEIILDDLTERTLNAERGAIFEIIRNKLKHGELEKPQVWDSLPAPLALWFFNDDDRAILQQQQHVTISNQVSDQLKIYILNNEQLSNESSLKTQYCVSHEEKSDYQLTRYKVQKASSEPARATEADPALNGLATFLFNLARTPHLEVKREGKLIFSGTPSCDMKHIKDDMLHQYDYFIETVCGQDPDLATAILKTHNQTLTPQLIPQLLSKLNEASVTSLPEALIKFRDVTSSYQADQLSERYLTIDYKHDAGIRYDQTRWLYHKNVNIAEKGHAHYDLKQNQFTSKAALFPLIEQDRHEFERLLGPKPNQSMAQTSSSQEVVINVSFSPANGCQSRINLVKAPISPSSTMKRISSPGQQCVRLGILGNHDSKQNDLNWHHFEEKPSQTASSEEKISLDSPSSSA